METKEQFKKSLDELGVKINLLAKNAKDQYAKQVRDLQDHWLSLKDKWELMIAQGGEVWENVKVNFKTRLSELQDMYDNLMKKL